VRGSDKTVGLFFLYEWYTHKVKENLFFQILVYYFWLMDAGKLK